ncbi:hypothetical protein [Stratiformator vulcanicus]|uniref:PilZ domain-containing protein n=1 Tax=Stratiformator vulcanicus TaxID=2527980 RepID=A0A517R4J9_9PLAN|nr:hypothetical protein [Stratiformator vulcanicus]QDT38780.1 hypothetical protein Pan189_31780 [Stratiformator vulcanicus]
MRYEAISRFNAVFLLMIGMATGSAANDLVPLANSKTLSSEELEDWLKDNPTPEQTQSLSENSRTIRIKVHRKQFFRLSGDDRAQPDQGHRKLISDISCGGFFQVGTEGLAIAEVNDAKLIIRGKIVEEKKQYVFDYKIFFFRTSVAFTESHQRQGRVILENGKEHQLTKSIGKQSGSARSSLMHLSLQADWTSDEARTLPND